MGVKTIIDSRGVVQVFVPDGTESVVTSLPTSVGVPTGASPGGLAVTTGSAGGVSLLPGFTVMSGSTSTTGTLPQPALYPGATITLYNSGSGALATAFITGSGQSGQTISISTFNSGSRGTKFTMNPDTSCFMVSDSVRWSLVSMSGSFFIS